MLVLVYVWVFAGLTATAMIAMSNRWGGWRTSAALSMPAKPGHFSSPFRRKQTELRAVSRAMREMELAIARLLFEELLEQQRHVSSLCSPVPMGPHSSIPVGDSPTAESSVDHTFGDLDDPVEPTITVSTFLGCSDVQAMVTRGDLDLHSLAIVLMEVGIELPRHSSLMENNILSFATTSSDGIQMNFAQFAEAFRLVNQLSIAANVGPVRTGVDDGGASPHGDLSSPTAPVPRRKYSEVNWEAMTEDTDPNWDAPADEDDSVDREFRPIDSRLDSVERWLRANDAEENG